MVGDLAARFAAAGLDEVPGLQVLRPSLEDVYLELVGTSDRSSDHDLEDSLR